MLSEAAELEHGIMCCYLFCAFSMKRDVNEGVTGEQLNSIRRWRRTIMQIEATDRYKKGLNLPLEEWVEIVCSDGEAWRARTRSQA